MKKFLIILSILLAACSQQEQDVTPPTAQLIDGDSIGHYCSMNLDEHIGPKAQLFIKSRMDKPYWFSTVKQMFVFRVLPEEPKDIVAIYVTDMSNVTDWSNPTADENWIDAYQAYYVIKSNFIGGMGTEDALPFSDLSKAQAFVAKNGGEIKKLDELDEAYIFDGGASEAPSFSQHHSSHDGHGNHGAHQSHDMSNMTSSSHNHQNAHDMQNNDQPSHDNHH
ncbi:nitrous oxide reductase accessory protein NosL [Pelistega ratti]|uniref:nitrous oxide reductase accessory protein NosL n=1 Tax=Pelistega ratti TaxID=2652177 RepID=UPI001357678D|nr:nitrous oxide reductase accessory protein NosL [Pelistega ratti]